MAFGLKYTMDWRTTEEQLVMVRIYDALSSGVANPYNIAYSIVNNGDGTQTVTITFLPLPTQADNVVIGYSPDGESYVYSDQSTVSPIVLTMPLGTYSYTMEVQMMAGSGLPNEVYVLNSLAPSVLELTPSGVAFDLNVVDSDEDIYKVFRAKQATIRFLSTAQLSLNSFRGPRAFDKRYYVTVALNHPDRFLFKGYLVLDDMEEPFLAPRNEVVLTATDQLGLLKNEALKDFANNNPRGKYTIAQYVAMALRGTGMQLPINVINNIREEGSAPRRMLITFNGASDSFAAPYSPMWRVGKRIRISNTLNNNREYVITVVADLLDGRNYIETDQLLNDEVAPAAYVEHIDGHFYNSVYLDARTFESEINSSQDGYTVLSALLAESCFVTQEKGEWWIKRHDETEAAQATRCTLYDAAGNWIQDIPPANSVDEKYIIEIGRDKDVKLVNNASTVSLIRPMKHVRHEYKYESPKEIVCNIDFARGEFIADLPDELVDAVNYQPKRYELDCWLLRNIAKPVTSTAFIKRRFYEGYEKERFAVITPQADAASPQDFLQGSAIEVGVKDKLNVSVDYRLTNNLSGGGATYYLMMIYLIDNAGNYRYWWHPSSNNREDFYWMPAINFEANRLIPDTWVMDDVNEGEWRGVDVELAPVPVDGKLYICLLNINQSYTIQDNCNVEYNNLKVEYKPLLNGGYRDYSGHSWTVTQGQDADKYTAVRDKTCVLENMPNKNFKGALLVKNGLAYSLAGRFYNANVFPGVVPGDEYFHPYGHIIVFDAFNQHNNDLSKLRIAVLGLNKDALDGQNRPDVPGLLHHYYVKDSSPHVKDKVFELLSFSQDFENCTWSGVIREVYDPTKPKVYTGEVFKYLE